MAQDGSRRFNWARLPLIATIARVLCREVTLENEYLRVQYEVVRCKAPDGVGSEYWYALCNVAGPLMLWYLACVGAPGRLARRIGGHRIALDGSTGLGFR